MSDIEQSAMEILPSLCLELFKNNGASKLTMLKSRYVIQRIWNYCGYPWGSYSTEPYIFRKIFSRTTFASQTACLYLEPLKNSKASKLTMLEKYAKMYSTEPQSNRTHVAYRSRRVENSFRQSAVRAVQWQHVTFGSSGFFHPHYFQIL